MTHLGRYQIMARIGHGGMGEVYRALDPVFERQVAIKTILGGDISAEQGERFLREIRAAGRLAHVNIVMSLDAGQDGGTVYVVMELIDGQDLRKSLDGSPRIPDQRLLEILSAAASGLDYAHSKGIVHRDVKPANILIGNDGSVKLADFGIAKLLDLQSITPKDGILGTPQYIAPELWKGERETAKCDQFSLAVLTHEALTGMIPFQGETIWALARSIADDEPTVSEKLLNGARNVIRKALSKDPLERFETCTLFVSELSIALGHKTAQSSESTKTESADANPSESDQTELEVISHDGTVIRLFEPEVKYPGGYGPSGMKDGIAARRGIEEATLRWSRIRGLRFTSTQEKNERGVGVWRHLIHATLNTGKIVELDLQNDWNMAAGGTGLLFGQTDLGETKIPFTKILSIKVLSYARPRK